MKENKNLQGHLMAIITILIWGTTFISTKILLRDFTPVTILFIRFIIGYIALFLFYPRALKLNDKKQEIIFALAGLCGVTLYFLLENIALTYSFASNIGVIISVAPFFTYLFANKLLRKEGLQKSFFIGFLLAMIGIAFISFNGSSVFKLNPMGDFLGILAALVWAVYSILTKKLGEYGYNIVQTTRRIFFYGLVFMIPAVILLPFNIEVGTLIKPINLLNLFYLGFGASAICFVSWNWSIKVLGAVKTSVYIYLVPVITVITSAFILKEQITWLSALGTLLTLMGLILSERKQKKPKDETNLILFKQSKNSVS
ncbi:DMT family transporter [Anaerosacchariphilus polymeriproducens]|uniref:DMT family transporter n=1 Tax=Anaerosacchariphilus polymeriproducens TaxID=1812858 RepID=A0A371ASC9_9FIRM|nr:DMT family transporter [Anaerosacchariphilus polymeriproducens]RDU22478.1 DMT family transporter [Anaerosacchariphilus polymeriproducens]